MNCFKSWNGANFQPQSWAVWWLSGRERMGNIEEDERTRERENERCTLKSSTSAGSEWPDLWRYCWCKQFEWQEDDQWLMMSAVCCPRALGCYNCLSGDIGGTDDTGHGLLQSVSSLFIIRICIRLRLRDHHPDWSIQLGLFLGIGNLITQDNW